MKDGKKITIKQISELCGVSQPVVSAILGRLNNPTVGFSEKTREKVLQVAEQYSYRPNRMAENFRKKRHGVIGIFIHYMGFIPHMADYWLLAYAAKRRQIITYELVDNDSEVIPDFLREDFVDGIIIFEDLKPQIAEKINQFKIPAVWVNTNYHESGRCVIFDERDAVNQALEKFKANGVDNLLFLQTHPGSHYSFKDRLEAINCCKEKNIFSEVKVLHLHQKTENDSDYRQKFCEKTTEILSSMKSRVGILTDNGSVCPLIQHSVQEAGLKIPKDVEIIAFWHQVIANALKPSISYLSIDSNVLSEDIIRILNDLMDGKPSSKPFIFKYQLHEKESTVR